MKERIYTIPINEAFDQDTECPVCVCHRKLESDALEYNIGPAMMEPDNRMETNKKGFCSQHFAMLYNLEQNRLPLALVIDTHMADQISELEAIFKKNEAQIQKESEKRFLDSAIDALKGKKSITGKTLEESLNKLEALEESCAVCEKVSINMNRLIENILYLYDKEPDFKKKFTASKGFCLKHFKSMLEKAQTFFSLDKRAEFANKLFSIEIDSLKRVKEDVNHFTKMFDYRNKDADWKNSRDAVPRSIEKLCGYCGLKR